MKLYGLLQQLTAAAVPSPAVVRSVRLDAAALWTFVDHLPWFQLKAFYVFLSGVPFWHGPLAQNKSFTNILGTRTTDGKEKTVTKTNPSQYTYRVSAHGPEV